MRAITIQGLTKRYGDRLVVDGLEFTVEQGSLVGFLGPNGAGKTTTLRMLLGLVRPTSGRALAYGRPYRDLPEPARVIGAVVETMTAHPRRTARHHLRMLGLRIGVGARRVDTVLELVGLADAADRRAGGFSLGMRQRLALAAALLGDPGVLVLDEPANGLDPEGIHWLRGFLRAQAAEGRTVLVSSHQLAEVEHTVDQVVIVARGRLVAAGPLDALRARASGRLHVRSPQAERLAALMTAAGAAVRMTERDRLEGPPGWSEYVGLLSAEHRIPLFELREDAPGLEEVFFRLTGAGGIEEAP
ncbi:ATP-binding cassette domain-containing protein [Actinoallomurus sp. NPDC052274]|uniref:ATP-binding cassette domain-containing protein n=1 Tax=Actinoallomurus sp. NPDC052274 TaxID=3155420 RepID=UPI00342CF53A